MTILKLPRKNFWELVRFLFAGGSCLLLELALLYAFTDGLGIYYLYATALSFSITVVVNYLVCRYWVFRTQKKQSAKAMTVFVGSSITGLGINQLCMWIFVSGIGIYYMLAKLLSAAIVTAWNFVLKKRALTKM